MTKKITQLTELTNAVGADLLEIVDDVGGTPASKKITLENLLSSSANQAPTGAVDLSGASSVDIGASTGTSLELSGALVVGGGSSISTILKASAALNFNSIAGGGATEDLTIALTGALTTTLGLAFNCNNPTAGIVYDAFIAATNVVTIRATNTTPLAINPANATFSVTVIG